MLVFAMSLVLAWSSALSLRKGAERARTAAIRRLREQILKNCSSNQDHAKKINVVLQEIKSIDEGAFLPFMQHPIVQTLLLPFGGIGGAYLIDYLEKMNLW
jgi:hypothetical protein